MINSLKFKKSTIVFSILLLIMVFGGTGLRYQLIKKQGKITVGTTTKVTYGGQSAKYINYIFLVNGKEYGGKRNIWGDIVKVPDGNYAVIYYENWPKLNTILFDYQLDTLSIGENLDSLIDLKKVDIGFWTL